MVTFLASWVLVAVAAGCGDDGGSTPMDSSVRADTGADADAPDGSFVPAPPAPPAPADATPCPEGWRERPLEGGAIACEPYAGDGPRDCSPYEAHFPGAAGCEVIGSPCPDGQFPDVPASASALYVAEGATGGDGTLAAPFGTVREAALIARSGTVIVVGKGSYTEELTLSAGVELRGACAAETVLTSTFSVALAGVVTVNSAEVVIRDLRIEGAARAGLVINRGSARAEGVILDGNTGAGVRVTRGGELVLEESIVRGTRASASDPGSGTGLDADGTSTLTARRVLVTGNRRNGVFANFGAAIELDESVVVDSEGLGVTAQQTGHVTVFRSFLSGNDTVGAIGSAGGELALTHVVIRGTNGWGVAAFDGGVATATKCLIESTDESGARSEEEGSVLTLEDTAILATRADRTPSGRGLNVASGGSATVRRLLISQAVENGVFVAEASLTAEDLTVVETLARPNDLTHGRALMMQDAARVHLTRALFERSKEAAVIAIHDGTILAAEDLTIQGTLPRDSDDRFGRALVVEYGAHAEVRRALFAGNLDAAIYVNQPGTLLLLEDAVIRDVASERSSMTRGRGVEVLRGAAMTMARVEVSRVRELGVLLSNAATLEFEDLRIFDIEPSEWDGSGGRGLTMQVESTATGRGLAVERCVEAGVVVAADSSLDVTGMVIRDVARVTCTRDEGCAAGFGMGLGVYFQSQVTVNDFAIEGAATCGVQLDTADLSLNHGVVSSCVIGACVEAPDFDLSRLQNDVQYVDNESNVDATRLPVPAIVGTAE